MREKTHMILQSSLIGPDALAWMSKPHSASVLHIFDRTCNLINDDRKILSIVTSEVGAGPFSIVLQPDKYAEFGFSRWVDASSPIQTETHTIFLGDLQVVTREAELWDPAPNWSSIRTNRDRWFDYLPTLQKTMDREAPPESFYGIVDDILLEDSEDLSENTRLNSVQIHAIGPARKLCEGIVTQNMPKIGEGAMGLAGLGEGLTPAGDDFIIGALMSLRSIVPSETASRIAETILSIVIPRTNSLSGAWLHAAANGETHETWRSFLEEIGEGSREKMEAAVIKILDVGHSSGADSMAGYLALNLIRSRESRC